MSGKPAALHPAATIVPDDESAPVRVTEDRSAHRIEILALVETSEAAARFEEVLRDGGLRAFVHQVAEAKAFQVALGETWDLVVTSYSLAELETFAILEILESRAYHVPLIQLGQGFTPDLVLQSLRAGIYDCVSLSELNTVIPAVERALRGSAARRRLEAELRQAQKMEAVGRLAGGVAHDLNNVLTIIQSFSELLREEIPADSPANEYLEHLVEAGHRAGRLTRHLLAYSRRQAADPRVVTFNDIASHTEKMLRRVIGEDIEVVMKLVPSPWAIKADPSHFEQVLLNLALNARDAMTSGGTLLIETDNVWLDRDYGWAHGVRLESGSYALLAVTDSGVGIPEEHLRQVFDPFFTTKEVGKGTGLGLSTCYGIVKQAGGFIWVYSEVGVGTTFKIYIPVTNEAPAVDPPTAPLDDERLRGGETLLVVEDDDAVRKLVTEQLARSGYRVIAASNGLEALDAAEAYGKTIDLVVTDVVMPKMGGKVLIEQLLRLHPHVRVLYMSGYTDEGVARQGALEARAELLEKPFTPFTLLRRIRDVLES